MLENENPILLVEDSPTMAKLAQQFMGPIGREIIHTANVHDTIAVLEQRGEEIGTAILDGNIPLDEDDEQTTSATDGGSIKRVIETMRQLELLRPSLVIVSFSLEPFSRYGITSANVAPARFIEWGKQRAHQIGQLIMQQSQPIRR